MEIIKLEIWEPDPDKPQFLRYVGQPVAEDVFKELEQRLKDTGFLPDEYFLMGMEWEHGRRIPKGADLFCTTDYGSSEGIYVDVYLKWYENDKPVTKSFATGKTLGETGYDLDRMFLTASTITKAFHGEGWHNEQADGAILVLNAEEKKMMAEILAQQEQTPRIKGMTEKLGSPAPQQAQTVPTMGMRI